MSKIKHSTILTLFFLVLLSSCEKEINIDLNTTNPRVVIEGNVSNKDGESVVKITKTQNFDETTPFPTVSDAFVSITDTVLSKTYILTESELGIYKNPELIGTIGKTYKLEVRIGEDIFTAFSTMPSPVVLDSLVQIIPKPGDPVPPAGTPGAGSIQFQPTYKNFTKTDLYFQYVITRNDTLLKSLIISSDLSEFRFSRPFPFSVKTKKNDDLKIDIQLIDKTVFDYLNGANQNIGQFGATPSNPTSNINNGALGFFKAHTSQRIELKVK